MPLTGRTECDAPASMFTRVAGARPDNIPVSQYNRPELSHGHQ